MRITRRAISGVFALSLLVACSSDDTADTATTLAAPAADATDEAATESEATATTTTTTTTSPPTTTTEPPEPVEVGVDWRRVEVAPDVSPRDIVVAGDRLWMVGHRGDVAVDRQGPVLFSTLDGHDWDEHDLRELGVPTTTLCGDHPSVCRAADTMLMGDGDGVVLLVDGGLDAEPFERDRWVVRGDASGLEVFDTDALSYAPWPELDDDELRQGRPSVGVADDGRTIAFGRASLTSGSTLVRHVIEPGVRSEAIVQPTTGFVSPTSISRTSSGFLLAGTAPGEQTTSLPSVWVSDDGDNWSGPFLVAPERDVEGPATYFVPDMAAGDEGIVVAAVHRPEGFGGDAPAIPLLWHSSDGAEWHETALDDLTGTVSVSLALLDGEFVALVNTENDRSLLTSSDGRAWDLFDAEIPPMLGLTTWDDGLVARGPRHLLVSKPGFWGGTDALEPDESDSVQLTRAADPDGPDDVGIFWRAVDLPDGVTITTTGRDRPLVVTGDRIWVLGQRDDRYTVLSSNDAVTWTELDLEAAGVPANWLTGLQETRDGTVNFQFSALLVPDGDDLVMVMSRYPVDNETIPPELIVVRSDGTDVEVWLPDDLSLGPWPGPDGGKDLRFGLPRSGAIHDGRIVLAGRSQWWLPFDTGDSSLLVTVIDPDRSVRFVAENRPPLGGSGVQEPRLVIHDGERFLVLGEGLRPDGESSSQLSVWASADGQGWTGVRVFDFELQSDRVDHLVQGPAGIVASGSSRDFAGLGGENRPVVWWHSPDGDTWTWVVPDAAETGRFIQSTWVFDGRYHSIVDLTTVAVLLSSDDGTTWSRTATHVPSVADVSAWGDGVVGHLGDRILISAPGFTAGELVSR